MATPALEVVETIAGNTARRSPFGVVRDILRDANQPAAWAALTACAWYGFGLIPLQLALTMEAGLDPARASSSLATSWMCAAAATIGLSLASRQPVSFGIPLVGLLFARSLAGQLLFDEILGAIMLAGVACVLLALTGASARIVAWVPSAVVMGMFAGVVVDYARRAVDATLADLSVGGIMVLGFVAGRALGSTRIPPVGIAALSGILAIALARGDGLTAIAWTPPAIVPAAPAVSLAAILTVTVPLVVVLIGMNLVPVCAFLDGQGYAASPRRMTFAIGAAAIIAPLFSGFAAAPSRDGGSIMAGPDAGPAHARYTATLVGGGLMIVFALAAGGIVALAAALPPSFVVTLTGLSMLGPLQSALARAFGQSLVFGPTVALVVAMTPFSLLGLPSPCWALALGVGASWLAERPALRAYWAEHAVGPVNAPTS